MRGNDTCNPLGIKNINIQSSLLRVTDIDRYRNCRLFLDFNYGLTALDEIQTATKTSQMNIAPSLTQYGERAEASINTRFNTVLHRMKIEAYLFRKPIDHRWWKIRGPNSSMTQLALLN